MNHPDFTQLRRLIDDAITYHDIERAQTLAFQGLKLAEEKSVPSEQMFFYAQLEIVNENFEEALNYLDKAIEFNPSDGAAFNDRALCMLELGKIEGVEEYFDKGIEVEPYYETIYHNKGWFLNNIGRYLEAEELLLKALELDPDRAVTYENLANVYENLERIDDAITMYQKALDFMDPSFEHIKDQINLEIDRLNKNLR